MGACMIVDGCLSASDDDIIEFITSLLTGTLKYEVNDELINDIAKSVSRICEAFPNVDILYSSDLASITNSLAFRAVNSENKLLVRYM